MYAADSSAHQAIQTKTPGLPVVLLRHPQTVQTVQTVKCRKICRTTAHVSLMKASAAATVAWYSVLPSLSYSLSILRVRYAHKRQADQKDVTNKYTVAQK